MNYLCTIDAKGRVTVPTEIRRRMGLSTGDRVDFLVEDGRIILRPSHSATNVFDKYMGALSGFPGGKRQINSRLSQMRGK
jgi:AbrB family looped-hinge helix DNA binding protein